MRYVLGIDQGASKTHAIVSDESGRVLSLVREDGLCNLRGLSPMELITRAADKALAQAGVAMDEVAVLVAGLSGIDWAGDEAIMEAQLRQKLGERSVIAVNDCIIALRAQTAAEYAAVICVGSGTNCAVRNGDNLFTYGFYIPDEHQGGMGLGIKAVQSVFDAEMGLIPPTALTEAILTHLGEPTVDALLRRRSQGQLRVQDYLSLPIVLERVAMEGDEVAVRIWKDYGTILARYVTARMRLMGMKEEAVSVVLSGSIFKCRVPGFIGAVRREILRYAPNAVISSARYEPIVGTVLMGLEKLHGTIPMEAEYNLHQSARLYSIRR